jgi:hypothetical protein
MGVIIMNKDELINIQIDNLKQLSSCVSSCYRMAPDEITALKYSLIMFAEANEKLIERISELESICPRITDADGRKIRWDAPDSAIPVTLI